jgi:diguanylate cyclase (GGDEF)-like protein
MLSNYLGGRVYSHAYIWIINLTTQGLAFVVVSFLVANLQEAVVREQLLSRTDALTGLLNNRAFYESANLSLALCHRNHRAATLAFIDLDNFKQVNDTAGHDQGDKVLKKFADILAHFFRSSDIVARIGGDEFVIFLPETGATEATVLLERIREAMLSSDDFNVFGVTTSIGAVAYQLAPALLADMVKAADTMMYSVKSAGKNAVNIQSV